jgi:4-diphosphocytidyl-2C-methyl-D-erythritol kinase
LTEPASSDIFTICRFESENVDLAQMLLENDFETTVFRKRPEIARVKSRLFETGARKALMSGSGASVFGIFDNEITRAAAFDLLSAEEKSWGVFLCETVSRMEYERALVPCFDLLT